MSVTLSRNALLALLPVFAMTTAVPGYARDSDDSPPVTVEAAIAPKVEDAAIPAIDKGGVPPAAVIPGRLPIGPCPGCPPIINRNGGTAIINFVAPITPKTMAELAKNAQNAIISGADSLRINISSYGGSITATQFAVNVIKTLNVPVETAAMSQIASAAIALFCMGDRRYMGAGTSLYLHQQTSVYQMQDKTAAAQLREFELNNSWYNGLLDTCIAEGGDRAALDYSSRDVLIDVDQANTLGMVTGPVEEMRDAQIWGTVINVIAPDPRPPGSGYPSYR